jgi:serralysin
MAIHGTESSETINQWDGTTNNADAIYGWGGADWIYALGGNDNVFGGEGDDWIFGGSGNDTLKGSGGADRLYGGFDNDTAAYDDSPTQVIVELMGFDGLGHGYYGTAEGDTLIEIENLSGSYYGDVLIGNDGVNTLTGLNGNDFLEGRGGADRLDGGPDSDTAGYTNSLTGVVVSLITNLGSGGDAQSDRLVSIENLSGSWQSDVLVGNDDPNTLNGLGGADSLKGGGGVDILDGHLGNDILDGGSGADQMSGGPQDDIYYVDNAFDTVTESGGQGSDTVRASVNYRLGSGDIEFLTTTDEDGTAPINLTGNASGNVVRGNNGNNTINGGHGNDELTGNGGIDWFLFDTPLDAMWNVDAITDFNVTDDTIRLDATIFSSSLTVGSSVAGSQFVIGGAALDAGDRIIYDNATGAVLYDSDGTGATAAVQFAQLSAGLADPTDIDPLTNFDFFVVA